MSDKEGKTGAAGKIVLGTAIAAAAGYVAGILTAPKSGKETRQDIKDKAVETYAVAEKQLKKLHTELGQLIAQITEKAKDLREKGGNKFDDILSQSHKAKDKAREMLTSLHEGEAEDEDLKKAIAEATKAISNLRTFLEK